MDAYFEIIEDMSINSEKGNVLKHLMQTNKLNASTYIRLFESLESFSLEREKGAVLLSAVNYMPLEEESVLNEFIETVEDMSSHYYVLKGEIMSLLVDKQTRSAGTISGYKTIILQLLSSAQEYNSNSQKGLTLRKINKMIIDDFEVFAEYKDCLESITDEIEKYNVILDLLETQKLSKNGYLMVLEVADDLVRSDYQHAAGAVMRMALNEMPANDELVYSFFGTIDKMDQNSTIEELLRFINSSSTFSKNDQVILKTIESLERIDVDIERSSVLAMIKPSVKTKEQKLAYSYAVKQIESDYLKRKVSF
jgi:hypothetical protein